MPLRFAFYILDEYFLNNIKEIEKISEEKKKILVKDNWGEDLLKSIKTYPKVEISDSPAEPGECEV